MPQKLVDIEMFRPLYHFSAPLGWINDPTGLSWFQNQWHLFFQHNPKSSKWGRMFWGHATTTDLIHFRSLPPALSPNGKNDRFLGCFSGSSLVTDDELILMYTGVPFLKQHQMIARSKDGLTFQKDNFPVIPSNRRPVHCGKMSFRDPYLFEHTHLFYSIIGAGGKKERQIILFKSDDLHNWTSLGPIYKEASQKGIIECPKIVLDEKSDLLIYSIMHTKQNGFLYQNRHSSVARIGKMDFTERSFKSLSEPIELDAGYDLYAPYVTKTPDGRLILLAWMQMWGRNIPTDDLKHGWAGMFTLPRELTIDGNQLQQMPSKEVYALFKKETFSFEGMIDEELVIETNDNETCFLKMDFKAESDFLLKLRKGSDCETSLEIKNGCLILDRSHSGNPIYNKHPHSSCGTRFLELSPVEQIHLELFLDRSSIEIFVNNLACMSATIYPYSGSDKISISSCKNSTIRISGYPLNRNEEII